MSSLRRANALAHAQTDRVPGTRQVKTTSVREWVCPDCDHFEDAEES
jgi:hypothetical protein